MGNLCSSKTVDEAVVEESQIKEKGESTSVDEEPRVPDKRQSQYYFDAYETISENEFNSMPEREKMLLAQSVFFSTRQSGEKGMSYAPATIANPHPRNSIVMKIPDTLLSGKKEEKTNLTQTVIVKQELQTSKTHVKLAGYPGELTSHELEKCLEFRRELKSKDKAYYEMVHVFKEVEEEPYALCRLLRSRKFEPPEVFELMSEQVEPFKKAQTHNFYNDVEAALGCSLSVFMTQLPFFFSGVAKNGCPVAYLVAGRLSVDGMDCMINPEEQVNKFMWYAMKHAFATQVASAENGRCEMLVVVDLKGLPASLINSRTLEIFKGLKEANGSFPELMNRTIVINAPSFFSFSWRLIRQFLDPRTREKVEIHSGIASKRMSELIEPKELIEDVGGQGPTFDQAIWKQRVDGENYERQTVELVKLGPGKESSFTFSLSATEQGNIAAYSRSRTGANLKVVSKGGDLLTEDHIGSSAGIPTCTKISTVTKGPGEFTVAVSTKGLNAKSAETFLVVVKVQT